MTGARPHRNRWAAVLIAGSLLLAAPLAGCRDAPEHRYMLYNDTSGQRQVSLCTDDACSTVTSVVGWVDVGAYADVTLPGDRVVLKVASVDAAARHCVR